MQEHMFHVKVHSGSFDNVFSCSSIDIANFIHENPGSLDLDLQGIWISDRMFRPFCTAILVLIHRSFAVMGRCTGTDSCCRFCA